MDWNALGELARQRAQTPFQPVGDKLPEDLAALDFAMHTLGPNQRTASNLQARWRHRNGSYRWLERNMLVLLNYGQVVGFRGSERDFTERRRQEKHISRLTRVLKMLSGVNSAMVRIRQRGVRLKKPLAPAPAHPASLPPRSSIPPPVSSIPARTPWPAPCSPAHG